jgi:hypothetical protein
MMAFMLTSVVEQAFFVDKACRVNLNFSDIICSNLADNQYKEYNKQVQVRFNLITAKPKQNAFCMHSLHSPKIRLTE